jgi:hypothetical protein
MGNKPFPPPDRSDGVCGPLGFLFVGYHVLFLRRKRPKLDVDVRNAWSYSAIYPYVFKTWDVVKYRNTFAFLVHT